MARTANHTTAVWQDRENPLPEREFHAAGTEAAQLVLCNPK
jgi:hypothetical protein